MTVFLPNSLIVVYTETEFIIQTSKTILRTFYHVQVSYHFTEMLTFHIKDNIFVKTVTHRIGGITAI